MATVTALSLRSDPVSPLLRLPARRYFKAFLEARIESPPVISGPPLRIPAKLFFANFAQPVHRVNVARQPCSTRRETVQGALGSFNWD
jgi:hypothetical protein